MTTATPTPTGTSAAELPQTGDKRRNGPLHQEDPGFDEKMPLPRQQAVVAEAASQFEKESFIDMIKRTIVAIHDWLAGPPTSAQDRIKRDIAEDHHQRLGGPLGGA